MSRRLIIVFLSVCMAAAVPAAARAGELGTTITSGRTAGFGVTLTTSTGLPLYIFTADGTGRSRCYGQCAKEWPVVTTGDIPVAAGRARPGLLGTVARTDGTLQVTYGGRPLYTWYGDKPGRAFCHDVDEFGGDWLLIRPSGRTVD